MNHRFFEDPAMDKLMAIIMSLASEVYILRERQIFLEELMNKNGIDTGQILDISSKNDEGRDLFVHNLLSTLIEE